MDQSELRELLAAYEDSDYPADFMAGYVLMECLSDRSGITTFLAQDQAGRRYIAKCCDKTIYPSPDSGGLLGGLRHEGLPRYIETFENEKTSVSVREYVEGVPLDRYAGENELTEKQIVDICIRLCDILAVLHHRDEPIIHRDIKPQNVIVKPDGSLALIDFDIARVYRSDSDTDTVFFGTLAYAPPEQYGFSQTDVRADIYSFGVLLHWLLTGSTRDNKNIRVYRPLGKIIARCTAFAPKDRFADIDQVKKALTQANPRSQALRITGRVLGVLLLAGLLCFAGLKIYRAATWSPFNADAIPAHLNDQERIADAVSYLKEKYGTALFDDSAREATMGLLRRALIELYGLDRDYVYASQEDLLGNEEGLPGESGDYFYPWQLDDKQWVRLSTAVYTAVKVHDPAYVADWSQLKDDTGEYPGERVAMLFAEQTGITTGANRPYDITVGELALILANTDRVFDAAQAAMEAR